MDCMPPSRLQLFFARDWPLKIWFTLIPLLFVITSMRVCGWPPAIGFLGLLFIVVVSFVAGVFSALLSALFILGPLYHDRALKNGAPFRIGDRVRILVGPHRGRVTRVYSTWQGDTVRVELGEEAKAGFTDIFGPHKLVRET